MEKEAVRLPIVPYGAFVSALDHFYEAGGAPGEIHSSVFPKTKFSGTTNSLLIRAFKELGMETATGKTDAVKLEPFINPETRKAAFQALLREIYGTLIDLPLATATPNQFNKWFDDFHMNSEDARKAKTFFLHAAKANDIPISSFILNKHKTRARTTTKPKTPREQTKGGRGQSTSKKTKLPESPAEGETRIVDFRNDAGRLTLIVSTGVMQLPKDERKLVLDLIEKIELYEEG